MSVLIKSFGNDRRCHTKEELAKTLNEHYASMSVTLVNKMPSGIDISTFVDVAADGFLTGSYDNKTIDLYRLHYSV